MTKEKRATQINPATQEIAPRLTMSWQHALALDSTPPQRFNERLWSFQIFIVIQQSLSGNMQSKPKKVDILLIIIQHIITT